VFLPESHGYNYQPIVAGVRSLFWPGARQDQRQTSHLPDPTEASTSLKRIHNLHFEVSEIPLVPGGNH